MRDSSINVSLGAFAIHEARVRFERVEHLHPVRQWRLRVELVVNDVTNPERRSTVSWGTSFQEHDAYDERRLSRIVQATVRDAVLHEVDEWLCINGERIVDPHAREKVAR